MTLTKQGVRNLGSDPRKPKLAVPKNCDHRNMTDCCVGGCGHYICPDCDEFWDDASYDYYEDDEPCEEDFLDVDVV